MPRSKKSLIRRLIDASVEGKKVRPTMLGPGISFYVPSGTLPTDYYIVTLYFDPRRPTDDRIYWACTCKGFKYREGDECRHVELGQQELIKLDIQVEKMKGHELLST